MRMSRALPSRWSWRNPLVTLGVMILVVYAAYKTAQVILADDLPSLAYAAMFLFGGAIVISILNDWRRGLYILVGWMLFEDFVRKYLGNNMAIYFAKDVLTLILYLSFFRARLGKQVERFHIPFRAPLLLFFWFAFLQIFNPGSTSIFFGILGLKVDFLYVPLVYIGYALMESEEELHRFFAFTCVLILIVAALGIAQSMIGPTFLNPTYLQDDIRALSTNYRVAPISGLVAYRPTSVFVSNGRFQDFLIFSWPISLGYGGYLLLRTRRGRTLAFATVGTVAAAALMSASRGVFMWSAGTTLVVAAGFLWGAPWRQREALRVLRAIQRSALVIGLGVIILVTVFPESLGPRLAIYSETLMPNSSASDLVNRTRTYPMTQLGYAFDNPRWPYGYGLGTCTLGWQYVIRIMHATPMHVGVESGWGNLITELGIVGLVLWNILGVSIVVSAWKVASALRSTPWFPMAFVICLFAFLLFFPMSFISFTMYQDFVINVYFWLSLGILYRMRMYPKAIQMTQVGRT